ncbi:MAG: hypothetical protein U0350_20755 [Caldilineaceae bacterium]
MNLDHFRPKGLPEFVHLICDPHNLVWCCRRCNGLKLDHWPAKSTDSTFVGEQGFIDPFIENRLEYFAVQEDGSLIPLKPPAHYMIDLLGLNYHIPCKLREMRLQSFELLKMIDEEIAYLQTKAELSLDEVYLIALLQKKRLVCEHHLDFTLYP